MAKKCPPTALAFKRRLLRWFRKRGRTLPWRQTRDPYHIAVSEFMLQQTQVTRVKDYYLRFLRSYPTVESLAAATPGAVRTAWDGLGYYRRAANLHQLARTVVREHGGTIPDDPDLLNTLPGVGRYTAGAIATFAYERRVPAIDTNVQRVLRRVFRPRLGRGARADRTLCQLATALLPKRRATVWEFNQALMDLGALVCTARTPQCSTCPVCPACKTGRAQKDRH